MKANCPVIKPTVHSASLPASAQVGRVYQCVKHGHLYKVKTLDPLKLVPLSNPQLLALIDEGKVRLKLRP